MAILGVESAVYGVDSLDACTRFYVDFGLRLVKQDSMESVFELPSGSKVRLLLHGDPRLPKETFPGNGVKETIWGVDTEENLRRLVAGLSVDREVRMDADGTAHCFAPDGQAFGLRVWNKHPVLSAPDPVNAPGNIKRLNQLRKWRHRALPKTINHVVFFSADYVESYEFYRDRLGFRYSDHSKGVGIFARADGTNEHHSIFWVNADLPVGTGAFHFMHIAFGVEDIDELMLGANLMEEKGWKNTSHNTSGGISRHRISSAIYYYCDNPAGGEAEYHADTDYLDDNWVPRAWDFRFGSLLWAHSKIPIFRGDNIPWDMEFDADEHSFEPYRKAGKVPQPLSDDLAKMTSAEEHVI